jgi:fumarate hydratase, class I
MTRWRRLVRDYEERIDCSEAMIHVALGSLLRMDGFTDAVLSATGLLVMVGKAERGPAAIDAIRRHGAAYLIAVGGAAYLVSKAIKSARVLAFSDLGMEAIHEFVVEDMPVTVAVDASGESIHHTGPSRWRRPVITRSAHRMVEGTPPIL